MIEQFTKLKDKGNELFKSKQFQQSLTIFEEAMAKVGKELKEPYDIESDLCKLFVVLLTNAALAANNLKSQDHFLRAQKYCTQALKIDANNVKALYRRAIANKELGQLLETTIGPNGQGILDAYQKAVRDFELLHVLDSQNALVKSAHAETNKNIFRVHLLQGKQVDMTGGQKSNSPSKPNISYAKADLAQPKKQNDMKKILQQYKIDEVTLIARKKVQQNALNGPLPETQAQLEKAIREIQKSPQVFLQFMSRMDEAYFKKIQPTFDLLFIMTQIVIDKGQGGEAKRLLETIRAQKSFSLLWKSYVTSQKKQFLQKWNSFGLPKFD